MPTNNITIIKINDVGSDLDVQEIIEASKTYINQVTLTISKVAEISKLEQQKLFEIFNKFKFVILECEPLPNIQENLLALKKFFGSVKRHHRSDENGIVPVENLGNSLATTAPISTTNEIHPMHTDGSADVDPPRIVALQCEIPSNNGGFSQIVYGKFIYKYFMENYPQELHKLLTYPVTVTNRGSKTDTRAVFIEKKGRISITFKADSIASTAIPSQIEKAFNIIKNYANDPKNQFIFKLKANQILLIDNTSVLHGRTSFPNNEVRKLNRLWFDGISEYANYLKFGFIPESKLLA